MRILFFTFALLLGLIPPKKSKLELICHTWKKVGTKPFHKEFVPGSSPEEEVITLRRDGNFEQVLNGLMQISGEWKFSADSTKLAFGVISMNGTAMPYLSLDEVKPTDSLIKLTADSLIYAQVAYYGPDQEYGHSDVYFVRADKK
jgi:hypothetical protein